jgi:hypothetical protein
MQTHCHYQRYFFPKTLFRVLSTFLILFATVQAYADDSIIYAEKLNQKLTDPLLGPQTIVTVGEFKVEGHWTPQEFHPEEINEFTRVAFDIGNWNFDATMSEATVFNPEKQRAVFSYKSLSNTCQKIKWLTITLEWHNKTVCFHVEGQTTQFLVSPLAVDFFPDTAGPTAASTVGAFRIGEHYGSFTLPLKGKLSVREKTAADGTVYQLKRVKLFANGTWATWVNNSLQLSSTAMSRKGICIENRTAALNPSANYPIIAPDTFPSVWPETEFPIENIRTFNYDKEGPNAARDWVLWAIQHNIKVLVGIDLFKYAVDLADLSADYLAADPYLRSCFDKNILAYSIGNEAQVSEIPLIIEGIQAAQALIADGLIPAKPISTVINPVETWIINTFPSENAEFTNNYLTLLPYLDILMFNTYGGYFFFDPIFLLPSLSWTSNGEVFSILLNQFGALRSAALKAGAFSKPFWVCETGWASAPLSTNPNEPKKWSSPSHLKTFYRNFLSFDQDMPYFPQLATQQVLPPDMIFYFGLRDSFLPLLNANEFFGLYKKPPYLLQKDL